MLSRAHRFHGYGSLRYVYRNGKVVRGSNCSLKYVSNNRITRYRVAVVVSKKVSKSAVVRNRIRRRVYEVVRELVVPDQPQDLVFTVYSEQLADMPADQLRDCIQSQLETAQISLV
jgi:ribonuclease P protein component